MYPGAHLRTVQPPPYPTGYRIGYALVACLTAAQALVGAYALNKTTGLSFLISVALLTILQGTKMFFQRSQHPFERIYFGDTDRWAGYLFTAFCSAAVAALGYYCLTFDASPTPNGTKAAIISKQARPIYGAPADGSNLNLVNAWSGDKESADTADHGRHTFSLAAPDPSRNEALVNDLDASPARPGSAPSLPAFVSDTFIGQTSRALGSWILSGILETAIFALLLGNRPRYPAYPYVD